jgi:hypothetical protein
MDPTAAGAQPASRTKNIARQLTAGSDAVRGAVGNLAGEAEQAAMPGLVEILLGPLRLESMLAKVSAAGFQTQVQSSLDKNNDSLPITRGQIARR